MSKGSHRRPTDEKKFAENFDAIFRKRTGWPEGMLQDDSSKLSKWLAEKPVERNPESEKEKTKCSKTSPF